MASNEGTAMVSLCACSLCSFSTASRLAVTGPDSTGKIVTMYIKSILFWLITKPLKMLNACLNSGLVPVRFRRFLLCQGLCNLLASVMTASLAREDRGGFWLSLEEGESRGCYIRELSVPYWWEYRIIVSFCCLLFASSSFVFSEVTFDAPQRSFW